MIRVVAGIIEHRGRLLICQRRASGAFALKWEFPGGKIHPSETPRAALRRELQEELGIEAVVGREVWRVRHRYAEMTDSVQVMFFWVSLPPPAHPASLPRDLAFERIRWVHRTGLARYDFLSADRKLISRLARGEL